MRPFLLVAENEFSMIIRNPIVPVFAGFLLMLAIVNAAGYSVMQDMYGQAFDHDTSFYIGISKSTTMKEMFIDSVCK